MKWSKDKIGECFLDVFCCLEIFLENKNCLYYYMLNNNLFVSMNVVIIVIFKDRVRRMMKLICVVCGVVIICKSD